MRLIIVLLSFGICFMASAIIYGFVAGDFFGESRLLLKYPWGQISIADLYTGLSLISAWIIFRERSWGVAVVWIILLVTLGNLASCAYALIAAVRAHGDWRAFWIGSRAA